MPSGYTSDIYDGKDITGTEFILKCARAFGANVMLREESLDVEIPTYEPSDYHIKQLEVVKKEISELKQLTLAEIQKQIDEGFSRRVEDYNKTMNKYNELESRYTKVLKEVEAWTPPTEDHVKLKEYAVNQLKESIKFDCNKGYLKYPEKETVEEWIKNKKESLTRNLNYHQDGWDEEVKRTNERNEWNRKLKESLL